MDRDMTPQGDTSVQTRRYGRAPEVSQAEAARVCGVSTATIRRARQSGKLPEAREVKGGWLIPIPDLVAAGLLDKTTPLNTPSGADLSRNTTRHSDTPATPLLDTQELEDLRQRLMEVEKNRDEWRTRALIAEAQATERAVALQDLRLSIRALTARAEPSEPAGADVPEGSDHTDSMGQRIKPGVAKRWGLFGRR